MYALYDLQRTQGLKLCVRCYCNRGTLRAVLITNSMEQRPSSEANSHSVEKFPAFYVIRRLITAFIWARHWSLFSARLIQSTPCHPSSLRSILLLSSRMRPGLPSGVSLKDFRPKLCTHFSGLRFVLHSSSLPSHSPWLDHLNNA
jgi:hypothetical protein